MTIELITTALFGLCSLIAGLYMGQYWLALTIMKYADAERAVFVGDRYYYVVDTRTFHALQVCRLRCEILDEERNASEVV